MLLAIAAGIWILVVSLGPLAPFILIGGAIIALIALLLWRQT
jgi:hypothetical protein